ncbi:MAG: hypothetical protein LPK12_11325 [Rhodobacterales bacterium]|nr:hypothetical protein [Rhodobacterales bacterium]MDX5500536.1 hypothetical protein [Rhodobacterales bacterium]
MQTTGQEFRISGSSMGSVLRAPEAVTAPDGSVLFAAYGMDAFSGGFALSVLRTNPETGAQTLLLSLPVADLGFAGFNRGYDGADIALRADGSFAVAFTAYSYATAASESALYVQTFSAAGAPLGAPQELDRWGPGSDIARDTRLEAAGTGYVLSYSMNDETGAERLYAMRLTAGGAPVADAVALEERGKPDMLALPGGDALLAWVCGGTIMTQIVRADGTVAPAQSITGQASSYSSATANDLELRRMDDGRIFALYEGKAPYLPSDPPGGLYLQELDARGVALGAPRLAVPAATSAGPVVFLQSSNEARTRFDLIGLPGGMMVLSYAFALETASTRDRNFDIGLTLLLPDGSALTEDPILLTENRLREQSSPYLLKQADGSLLLAFYDERAPTLGGRTEMRAVEIGLPDGLRLGTAGDDRLFGGSANDMIYALDGNDRVVGFLGNDTLDGGAGNDTLEGREGDDQLSGGRGDDFLHGGAGNDTLMAGLGKDTIWAGAGHDLIEAQAGDNEVWAGPGNDTIFGGSGNDTLGGGADDDVIDARTGGRNELWGATGNDTLYASDNGDAAGGGAGQDAVYGGGGADTLMGGPGNDIVNGGGNDDLLYLAAGDDMGVGSLGNDTLLAGPGFDRLWGSAGADRFEFWRGNDWNRIEDFDAAQGDTLALGRGLWVGTHGALTAQQVVNTFGRITGSGDAVLDFAAAGTTVVVVGAGTLDGLADSIVIL